MSKSKTASLKTRVGQRPILFAKSILYIKALWIIYPSDCFSTSYPFIISGSMNATIKINKSINSFSLLTIKIYLIYF